MKWSSLPVLVVVVGALAACGGPKKRHVTKDELEGVVDYVNRNMHASNVAGEDRRKYVVSQLGGAHRTDGELLYWYTSVEDCYYLQVGEDGWASWGIGQTNDCKKYAVTK